jgi:signal peptidase I
VDTRPPTIADDGGEVGGSVEELDEEAEASKRTRTIVEWVLIIVGAFLVAFVVKTFLIQAFYIPSDSMEPTLEDNDRVLVNKLSYDLHDVHRGDLVVFERPEADTDATGIKDLIKRVVGLEGETIEARDGIVYIDGERLDEPYVEEGTPTLNLPRQVIPADHVFVMGDNRDDSSDSRVFGAIDEELIVGRAFVRVWPLFDIGLL